jgi:hypothetical protein
MLTDTKPEENNEVSKRVKLKEKRETTEAGKINKKAEKTGNCTKSLETIRKSAICRNKDFRLNN